MKIVIAIEGIDGAGKSSIVRLIYELCRRHQQPFTKVGRRNGYVNSAVTKLTHVLGREAANLTPQAEIFVRLAREAQRAHLASTVRSGIVVLDRFVLSVLTVARTAGQEVDLITKQLREVALLAELHATVHVRCPLDVAWTRIMERGGELIADTDARRRLLKRMAKYLEEDYHRGILTGQQWIIDNSTTLDDAVVQLEDYLLPYLRKRE